MAQWTYSVMNDYTVAPNIIYLTANGREQKLDLYRPNQGGPHPTLLYIHGGGWVQGNKESAILETMPFLEKGWAIVNVEYRLASVSMAPAAVEDCRCALRWVFDHAQEYHLDVGKLVVMGNSAGGHLALTTGMLSEADGLDRQCPERSDHKVPAILKVSAIIDWYGITDVNDLLQGSNLRDYAVAWFGSMLGREEIAKQVSPLTYVRASVPPIMMIHGDADQTVPYSHSTRLHLALDKAHVPNELVTIHGGDHGQFSRSQMEDTYSRIWSFLALYLHP